MSTPPPPPAATTGRRHAGKGLALAAITAGELLALALCFSASAVEPQLQAAWNLTGGEVAWLTASVQLGFVMGAFGSASANLPDCVDPVRLFAASALAGSIVNAAVAVAVDGFEAALVLRFLTGGIQETVACSAIPESHRRRIRSTNGLERFK